MTSILLTAQQGGHLIKFEPDDWLATVDMSGTVSIGMSSTPLSSRYQKQELWGRNGFYTLVSFIIRYPREAVAFQLFLRI